MVGADEKLRKLGNLLLVTYFFFLLCKCQQLLGDRELQHVLSALHVDLNFSKGGEAVTRNIQVRCLTGK